MFLSRLFRGNLSSSRRLGASPRLASAAFPHHHLPASNQQVMSFHFASSEYAACFQGLPVPDVPKLRSSAIEYLDGFDKQSWYNDPVSLFGVDGSAVFSIQFSHFILHFALFFLTCRLPHY
jgi:hypothetical protein